MNEKLAELILAWYDVYVDLTECVEDARIVLDQSDRGTLLPDRVREMREQLIKVQDSIPRLADLMEAFTGVQTWPMKVEDVATKTPADEEAEAERAMAKTAPGPADEPAVTTEGDYDATEATPAFPDDDAANMDTPELAADEETAAEADATGAP